MNSHFVLEHVDAPKSVLCMRKKQMVHVKVSQNRPSMGTTQP